MSIFTDSVGNTFLGDCIWGTHNSNYPTQFYLTASPFDSLISNIQSWFSTSGNLLTYTNTQETLNTLQAGTTSTSVDFFRGAFASDLAGSNPKFKLKSHFTPVNITGSYEGINLLAGLNNGDVNSATNNILRQQPFANTNFDSTGYGLAINDGSGPGTGHIWFNQPTCFGVMNNASLGFGIVRFRVNNSTGEITIGSGTFWYIGILDDLNTNLNYYTSDPHSKYFVFSSYFRNRGETTNTLGVSRGGHRPPFLTARNVLENGRAIYPIVCADGQTPTENWMTDFYVFDNDVANNRFPAMGKVRNLGLAQGSYTLLKPVKIQGTTKPDNGFNRWLPIGYWGDMTVFTRCYSSQLS